MTASLQSHPARRYVGHTAKVFPSASRRTRPLSFACRQLGVARTPTSPFRRRIASIGPAGTGGDAAELPRAGGPPQQAPPHSRSGDGLRAYRRDHGILDLPAAVAALRGAVSRRASIWPAALAWAGSSACSSRAGNPGQPRGPGARSTPAPALYRAWPRRHARRERVADLSAIRVAAHCLAWYSRFSQWDLGGDKPRRLMRRWRRVRERTALNQPEGSQFDSVSARLRRSRADLFVASRASVTRSLRSERASSLLPRSRAVQVTRLEGHRRARAPSLEASFSSGALEPADMVRRVQALRESPLPT
jgi:predicted alpha/beta hydrolase